MPGLDARLSAFLKLLTALIRTAYRTFRKAVPPLTFWAKCSTSLWARIAHGWISRLNRNDVDKRKRHPRANLTAPTLVLDGGSGKSDCAHDGSDESASEVSALATASITFEPPRRDIDKVDQGPEDHNREEEALTGSDNDGYATSSNLTLIPIAPTEMEPYKTREFNNSISLPEGIPPLSFEYYRESISGWTLHNTARWSYFSSAHGHFTVYTMDDVRVPPIELWIQKYSRAIAQRIGSLTARCDLLASNEVDLVLDLTWSSDMSLDHIPRCSYYFAHRQRRTVFWLDRFENASTRILLGRPVTDCVLLHGLQRQFWTHCHIFPHGRVLPPDMLVELENNYHYWNRPNIVGNSDGGANHNRLETNLELIRHGIDLLTKGNNDARIFQLVELWATFFRLRKALEYERIIQVPSAYLDMPMTSAGSKMGSPLHIRMLQVSMFYLPCGHSIALRSIFMTGVPLAMTWNKVCRKNMQDWRDLTLYSTLLLNANVAFLTVGSVDGLPDPSYAKIAAYVSSVASFGSIFTGLMLVRNTHPVELDVQVPYTEADIEILALVFSLPFALLIWGSFAFVTAFGAMCMSQPGFVTRTVFGMAMTCVAASMLALYMFVKKKRYCRFLRYHASCSWDRIVDAWREFTSHRKPKDNSADGGEGGRSVNEEHEMRGRVEEGENVGYEGQAGGADGERREDIKEPLATA